MRREKEQKRKILENYIELELQLYQENKRLLEELKLDIIEAGMGIDYQREKVTASNLIDDTLEKYIKIESSVAIIKTERTIRAIDKAIKRLSDVHKRIFELHYVQEESVLDTCNKLPCSVAWFYVCRRDIIKSVAQHMGINY